MRFGEDVYVVLLWSLLSLVTCNPVRTTITRPCFGQFGKRSIAGIDATENGCLKDQTSLLILYLEMAREEVNTTNTKISGYVDVDPTCHLYNQPITNDNTAVTRQVVEASILFYYPVLLNMRSQIENISSDIPIGSPVPRRDIPDMIASIDRCMCSMSMIIGREIVSVTSTRDLDTTCTHTCTDTASGQLTIFMCKLNTVLKEGHLILNKLKNMFTDFDNVLNCNPPVLIG